jgi:hypothetical protein
MLIFSGIGNTKYMANSLLDEFYREEIFPLQPSSDTVSYIDIIFEGGQSS